MTKENASLFASVAKVMAEVRSLPKNGRNKQSNYDYVSSDDALEAIGKAMAKHGVVVIPSMLGYESLTDGKMTRTKAEFDMHVCSSDGGAFVSRWFAEGIDYGNPDKALTKAITYATKTFLLKLFVVGAGGDDPDGESAPTTQAAQSTQQPQRTNGKAQATKPQAQKAQPKAEQPTDETPMPAPVAEWLNAENPAKAAQAWSVECGAQQNEHSARNSMKKIVDAQFDGQFTKANVADVLTAFYFRQHEHLAELADAAATDAEAIPA